MVNKTKVNVGNKENVLLNWSIQYDNTFNMPEQIQGTYFGPSDKIQNGSLIKIDDIEQLDLDKMQLVTNGGQNFILFGSGVRRYEYDHEMILNMFLESEKINEDNEDS